MHLVVDPAAGTVELADPSNFRAFHVVAPAGAPDDAVAAALAAAGAGRDCADPDHVWVARAWIERTAPGLVDDDPSWPDGFAKMLAFAEKNAWLDDAGSHIKAHVERS